MYKGCSIPQNFKQISPKNTSKKFSALRAEDLARYEYAQKKFSALRADILDTRKKISRRFAPKSLEMCIFPALRADIRDKIY